MAAGSVTVAALRHRPRQAALVIVLAAMVTAAAALGPLYARAVEQSVLRTVIGGAPVSSSGIVVTATGTEPPSPARLARVVAPATPAQFGRAVRGADTAVVLRLEPSPAVSGSGPVFRGRLASRAGSCAHLEVAAGRCVSGPGDVMLSRRSARAAGVEVGSTLRITPESGDVTSSAPVSLAARSSPAASSNEWPWLAVSPSRAA